MTQICSASASGETAGCQWKPHTQQSAGTLAARGGGGCQWMLWIMGGPVGGGTHEFMEWGDATDIVLHSRSPWEKKWKKQLTGATCNLFCLHPH